MPNQSDYDMETGELLNPDFWNGPPDCRMDAEKIDDYFANSERCGLIHFDLYKDWLFYPPRIETQEDADSIYQERVNDEFDRIIRNFNTSNIDTIKSYIENSMDKYKIEERLDAVVSRFCRAGKPRGWTRYKERDKILISQGKKVEHKKLGDDEKYIIDFHVTKSYRFAVRADMSVDDMFEWYSKNGEGGMPLDEDKFKKLLEDGTAVETENFRRIEPESLWVIKVDKNNWIIDSRIF